MSNKKEINHALYETTRPPMYTAMKYWGKKPHNIWSSYIDTYTPEQGIFLDPFSGSAMSVFEAVLNNKQAIALDINPLTSFFIEVFASNFDKDEFNEKIKEIILKVENDKIYKKSFEYRENYTVHNVKYENNEVYEVALVSKKGKRSIVVPETVDKDVIKYSNTISIIYNYPNKTFHNSISFTNSFLENIGKTFDSLYTKRNLYVLSLIFDEIVSTNNEDLKKQLLYTFIKTVHLTTKMNVPRSKKTNRDFSTSWGRAAYIYSKKQMEMNPLLVFSNAATGKQSTESALLNFKTRLKRTISIKKLENRDDYDFFIDNKIDILYGVLDIKEIAKILPEKEIDFILTDPPYGGVVQYLDLSSIWLSWLELYDVYYKPNYNSEITINNDKSLKKFELDMTKALLNLNKIIKDNGKIVLTFNNKNMKVWQSLLKAIENSGLKIEHVIHQQNRRTGESNVSDPFGSSASDFYIRCIKSETSNFNKISERELEEVLINVTREIIIQRNEPTPYQILFNGVLASMSMLNLDYRNIDSNFNTFLRKHENDIFITSKNFDNSAGNYWWIKDLKFDKNSNKTLTNKVHSHVYNIFQSKSKINECKLYESVYKKFPNGLTPDPITLNRIIDEISYKKGNFRYRKE